ncbi:hypothetical protein BK121_03350 [Paenibacillus odorifer]|uniref:DUF927 domain-containing protein n=1 Tax=Paenibacillus odorifer TaxID=189426 RepID=UPI00096F5E6A|nr:DUF927 domain-containing protein [Paenibacillus odorifer]OMC75063.1 hypothetical protein BK121_03350 [Paenibacillus odorifer]
MMRIDDAQSVFDFFKENYIDEEFGINDEGDFCRLKNAVLEPITNFCLVPLEIINKVKENNLLEPYKYVFTGFMIDGTNTTIIPKFEVLHKEINRAKWLDTHIPFGIIYKPKSTNFESILRYIHKSLKKLSITIEYETAGWHMFDGKWSYLLTDETIGESKDKNIITTDRNSSLLKNEKLNAKEAFQGTLSMLNICDPKLTHGLLGHTLISLITTPLMSNELSPNFSMWIYGKSGLGKTSIAELFTQIFKSKKIVRVDDYKRDIKKNALQKDCVSIFDDYGTAKTKQTEKQTEEKVESIIRWLGDRSLSSNSTVIPEGMTLFTGESFLDLNKKNTSSIARVIRVEMDNIFNKQERNYDPLKAENFTIFSNKLYLPTSIRYYLEWLSRKLNSNFTDRYREDFKQIKHEIKDSFHERHIDAIAHLIVSFNFYLSFGLENEYITPEEFRSLSTTAKAIFLDILNKQNLPLLDPDVELFMNTLKKLIIDQEIPIRVIGIPFAQNIVPKGIVNLEEKTMSMNWQFVYDAVFNELLDSDLLGMESNFVTIRILGKLLQEHNLIYRQNGGKNTKPITELEGRSIQFKTDKIPDLINQIIEVNKSSLFNKLLEDYSK